MSHIFAVGLGIKIIWNQASVVVAFKSLVSIDYYSFDQL